MSAEPDCRRAKNGYYYVYWTEGRRSRRQSTGCKEHTPAQAYFSDWLLGRSAEPEKRVDAIDFGLLWDEYFQQHVEPKTLTAQQIAYVGGRLKQHFGEKSPRAITQSTIDEYVRKRADGKIGRSARVGSVRREITLLMACLRWCASPRRKLLDPAFLPAIEMPEASAPRDRWLRIAEVQALLDAARKLRTDQRLSPAELFLWLALETGSRKTAIQELTWDRVDFETRVIHYALPGRRTTRKRRGSPPISSALLPLLQRGYQERRGDRVLADVTNLNRLLHKVAKDAGVPGVTPHVLRHTAATLMARRGVPIAHIADLLCITISTAENVYRHHCPDATRAAVENISAGLLEAAE